MEDSLLTENLRKAELSFVYLSAIASISSYTIQRGPSPDVNSIDALVNAGGNMAPEIRIQLKATSSPRWGRDGLRFRLSRKNYDEMRQPRVVPIFLAVMVLPEDPSEWLTWKEEEITIRRCIWWKSLRGYPAIDTQTRTVTLPNSQMLSPESLKDLMSRVRRGELSGGESP